MAAKEGNKYAEKWTREETMSFLEKVANKAIESNSYHLQRLIIDSGGYATLWAYLSEKWANDKEVFDTIKRIEQIMESNIVNDALTGDIKGQAMAIFYLKNKHDYKDQSEIKQNISLGIDADKEEYD